MVLSTRKYTILLVGTFSSLASSQTCDNGECVECGLYMAESTIPNAGLGIFSGIPREVGDTVGDGDICIPLLEMDWHNQPWNWPETRDFDYFNPFRDYVWNGREMGMAREVDSYDIEAYCPGLDCAINCNLPLINVAKSYMYIDDAGLHRSHDPGAGALTPYQSEATEVIHPIPAGGELFKHYGDNWFTTREHIFSMMPLTDDYPAAQELLDRFGDIEIEPKKEFFELVSGIIHEVLWESRTLNAFPKTWEEAEIGDLTEIHQRNATRSLEDLKKNGKCIDNIRKGRSTLHQAGHGAFSTRFLPEGTIVTGSPLFHLPYKQMLAMYDTDPDDDDRKTDVPWTYQVTLNYCFGHVESTLLLCPYGTGINSINHNQTLANLKIQWAEDGATSMNHSWFDMTPEELEGQNRKGLAFDYIATRDIEEGEELFLDYGDVFELAWQNHVAMWSAAEDSTYASAATFNRVSETAVLRTEEEQAVDPYPSHLELRCHQILLERDWRMKFEGWDIGDYGFPCRIRDRETSDSCEVTYQIDLQVPKKGVTMSIKRRNVPREFIAFQDTYYSSDLHLKTAFRHEAMIPDHMVPTAWRNLS